VTLARGPAGALLLGDEAALLAGNTLTLLLCHRPALRDTHGGALGLREDGALRLADCGADLTTFLLLEAVPPSSPPSVLHQPTLSSKTNLVASCRSPAPAVPSGVSPASSSPSSGLDGQTAEEE